MEARVENFKDLLRVTDRDGAVSDESVAADTLGIRQSSRHGEDIAVLIDSIKGGEYSAAAVTCLHYDCGMTETADDPVAAGGSCRHRASYQMQTQRL